MWYRFNTDTLHTLPGHVVGSYKETVSIFTTCKWVTSRRIWVHVLCLQTVLDPTFPTLALQVIIQKIKCTDQNSKLIQQTQARGWVKTLLHQTKFEKYFSQTAANRRTGSAGKMSSCIKSKTLLKPNHVVRRQETGPHNPLMLHLHSPLITRHILTPVSCFLWGH